MPLVEPSPRAWQKLFLTKYTAFSPVFFLLVACPGAGKTLAALFAARDLLRSGVIDRIVVYVPGAPLREQWSAAAALLGITLDGITVNNDFGEMETLDGVLTQGWVVTYQSLISDMHTHRALNAKRRTLVIFDEVHHLSESSRWGESAMHAVEPCVRVISLSGTPFRGDGYRIPFVEYVQLSDDRWECRYRDDADGTPYPRGFDYSYGVAPTDKPPPVRPLVFEHFDGPVEWMDDDGPMKVRMSDALSKKVRRRANRHVLNAAGGWLTTVLTNADQRLDMVQAEGDRSAKGVILCRDRRQGSDTTLTGARGAAYYVARLKRDAGGERPDPKAVELLSQVLAEKVTPNAAARQMGWRKPRVVVTTPEAVARRLRAQFTPEEIALLVKLLIEDVP